MPLPRFRLFALAGLVCLCLFSTHLGAQPLTLKSEQHTVGAALRVFGGQGCVRPGVVAEDVTTWLGFDLLPASWTVVVVIRDEGAQFSIFERGQLLALRRFEELQRCADFELALGASIGLSLEALLARRLDPPLKIGVTKEAPRRRAKAASPLASIAYGTFAPATLPRPAWGAGLLFELGALRHPSRGGQLRSRVGVMALWGEDAELPFARARFESRLLAARLGQCWGEDGRFGRLQGCTDFMAGYVSGSSSGELRPLGVHLPWIAWGLGLEGRLWLRRPLALYGGVQSNIQLVRPTFRVLSESGNAVEELHLPWLGFMVHAGVSWSYR